MQYHSVVNIQQEEQVKLRESVIQKQAALHIDRVHKQEDRDI
jgi:hypothetical protein